MGQKHRDQKVLDCIPIYLEGRVANLEQYMWINDVLITGLKIKPRLYAKLSPRTESWTLDSVEQQVTFYSPKELSWIDLDACHTLHIWNSSDRPAVILQFTNRQYMKALLKQDRKQNGADVFINTHLAKRNVDTARKSLQLKKQRKIRNSLTSNPKVSVNGTAEEAKVISSKNFAELDKF